MAYIETFSQSIPEGERSIILMTKGFAMLADHNLGWIRFSLFLNVSKFVNNGFI